jgi:3',5'-cyclic AMP phosphodiesterase CpdA
MNYKILFIFIIILTTIFIGCNLKNENKFTIIVMPDTQNEIKNYPYVFSSQINWINDNKGPLNIKYVISVGDIVDDANSIDQWNNFNKGMSILEKNDIPYFLVPGNHDYPLNNFKRYFPKNRLPSYDSSNNSFLGFSTFSFGNNNYTLLGLGFCPRKYDIDLANAKVKNRDNIIRVTHGFLNATKVRYAHLCGSTEYIWDGLIRNNPNFIMVLSGHVHNESRRQDLNKFNQTVYQLLADYQDDVYGGNGWLRIMTFYPDKKEVHIKTYSPSEKRYKTSRESDFILNYKS